MRDPEDQLASWYRYRRKEALDGSDKSTAAISFDQFVRDVISDDPPPHAGVGSQFRFLTARTGEVLVHRLFAYDDRAQFQSFLEERFGEALKITPRNVSPGAETELDPKTRAALHRARAEEFALYERLRAAGGVLQFDVG